MALMYPNQAMLDTPNLPFLPFNPTGDLYLQERLRLAPATNTIKGMFFQSIAMKAKILSGDELFHRKYIPFRDYPASEFISLAAAAAAVVYPDLPPRQAIRYFGREHYQAFTQQTIGRVLMGFAGTFIESALNLIPRAYSLAGGGVSASLVESTSTSALISLRNSWDIADCHEVGVFEGVLNSFQVEGEVLIRTHSFCDVDLYLSWRRRK